MVNERIHALRIEVSKDRNENCLVCVRCEEGDTPTCRVLCAEGYLVSLLETYRLEEDVESCDMSGKITESKFFTSKVCKRCTVPVALDCILQSGKIVHSFFCFEISATKVEKMAYAHIYFIIFVVKHLFKWRFYEK